ncbi:L-seryl-tRNA(Sec) selenium transferase [Bacillus sp. HMF5848]|uniref:L-seryl-tRNA(Sec) selenium transferase n=1 Tax=Bacillus sp. HMF5848 TaxID=2495421 RepID=UPI000F7AE0EA|nr:L-seryl-tRNA(Sec) selenium transferase [Bacillus sp. HMF5848]RSK27134.1 L-seryl-tRNA(Sec) selenium transferase [Bacillus sp. HMF5848]
MNHILRQIPAIHELQKHVSFQNLCEMYNVTVPTLTSILQEQIHILRINIINGYEPTTTILDEIFINTEASLKKVFNSRLNRLINATGTILHTNLGRARLSDSAITSVVEASRNYSNLEYNIDTGKRGSRHDLIEDLVTQTTGAEAAMVVNNNAASVYLILKALAKGKEVIVSRGELVEIGGSFRISSIMEESGANLVEVGTTNKTHMYDYENSVSPDTAMIMKVHTSNYKILGFHKTVPSSELVDLCKKESILLYEDLGSGALFDYASYGIGDEPVVAKVLRSGIDVVSFSGDKLLGGPQAGIIAGKKQVIEKLKKHQLARVLRVDKMTLAALEATLRAYLRDETTRDIPVVRDILTDKAVIKRKALDFISLLKNLAPQYSCELHEDTSKVGGGTMPDVELPTWTVRIQTDTIDGNALHDLLRKQYHIVTRIKDDIVFLDFRTLTNEEVHIISKALKELGGD